jgi:LacI family transcriptional regulator
MLYNSNILMDRQGRQARIARNGFREITDSLKDKIKVGDVSVGSYLPTERELQVDFGASRSTVRKALAALIESGWAQGVPNRGVMAARGMKPRTSKNVAFINSGNYVSQILLNHLCGLLENHGLNLVAVGGRADYPMEYGLQRAAENEHLGAIVWPNVGFPDVECLNAIARTLPIVAIDHPIPGIQTDVVTFDHERAAYDATNHLIRLGARRVGVTGMMDMLTITHDRFKGYLRALFANGLQPNPTDFLFTMTSGDSETNTHVFEQVLRSEDRPDAFFVLNDICMPSAIAAADRIGLDMPGQLKFAAIGDDLDIAVSGVRMTAVAFDWGLVAEKSVELLLDRLDNLNRATRVVTLPHRLKIRGLCGAPPEEWTQDLAHLPGESLDFTIPRVHHVFNNRWQVESGLQPSRSGEILI